MESIRKRNDYEALLARAAEGDFGARDLLLSRIRPLMVEHGRRILRDADLAEDAAQEAILEFAAYLPQIRLPASCPAIARRMVVKACDRILRKGRIETISEADPAKQGPGEQDTRLLKGAMRETLDEMSELDRHLFQLRFVEERSVPDCARRAGLGFVAARYRIHLLRRNLADGLRRRGFGPMDARMMAA